MNTPPSPPEAERSDKSAVRIGALVPLTRPGWVEAGRHLLAGLELAVREVNDAGGIVGRPLDLTDEQLEAMIEHLKASLEAQAQSAKVIEGEAEVVPSLPAPVAPKPAL